MSTWKIKIPDPQLVSRIQQEFNCSQIIASVMANRNILSKEEAQKFFSPSLESLHDPFLMQDMDKAADRLADCIKNRQNILVFGDYDVDGTTGASTLGLFINSAGGNSEVYVPDRETEGYGLSTQGVDKAEKIGAELIITSDCGITGHDSVDYANSRDIDVIITDHHMPSPELPNAYAVLNPKRDDCSYPFKGLCGGGVTLKLAEAVAIMLEIDPELVYSHLDLITLGTSADLVPILDENRAIVHHGLKSLKKTEKPGLHALLEVSNLLEKELTVGRLIFGVAPRINAAGRLGDANRAVALFSTDNPIEAAEIARNLDEENRNRQDIQQTIVDEALLKVNSECDLQNENAIVLWEEGWHQGVIGIVASRIKEEFHRPTVIIAMENGVGKGSARSIYNFDLYENFTNCAAHLDGFGGHPMAAGMTISKSNLPLFRETFINLANNALSESDLVGTLTIETEMKLSDINGRFMEFLDKLAPFGPGNMRPQFVSRKVEIAGKPRLVGNGDHLKFRAKQNSKTFDAIAFNMGKHYSDLLSGKPFDLAFVVEENEWQGRKSIQLNIRDIKLRGGLT
ncbi:MAG: single-stranded-DNA-specific exonuclease RecJ [Candidatus Marinimicrobia bacterium]|nr:single-stranded-DNA-specific exonuclease RecJ [Candidatus Neomarinimicrobiota bacterium]